MPRLHVVLVTGRPEANLIPLLQLKPDYICLVASERMATAAEHLNRLLRKQLPDSTRITTHEGLPDSDPEAISRYAFDVANTLDAKQAEVEGLEITYDLTGGTKLMALLFQEAMRCCDAKMLYVDSDAGKVYHMGAELKPDSFNAEAIQSVLATNLYLQANGKKRGKTASDDDDWRERVKARKVLTKYLAQHAKALVSLFGQLNYLIHVSQPAKPAVLLRGDRQTGQQLNHAGQEQQLSSAPRGDWKAALERMSEAGVLEWSAREPRLVRFTNKDGALYTGGGWLEEYAWHCAQDADLEEVFCGAEIIDETERKADVRNEFDCLAVHRNRMLIAECKTGRLDRDERDQQVLHKLHSLADQSSGLYGTRVLLTSQEFGSLGERQRNLKRAQGMGIHVVEGADLKRLTEHIRMWRDTGRWPAHS